MLLYLPRYDLEISNLKKPILMLNSPKGRITKRLYNLVTLVLHVARSYSNKWVFSFGVWDLTTRTTTVIWFHHLLPSTSNFGGGTNRFTPRLTTNTTEWESVLLMNTRVNCKEDFRLPLVLVGIKVLLLHIVLLVKFIFQKVYTCVCTRV